jgi:hypothetical protein
MLDRYSILKRNNNPEDNASNLGIQIASARFVLNPVRILPIETEAGSGLAGSGYSSKPLQST